MSLSAHEVVLRPVISEKSIDESGRGKYTFQVHPEANKIQIKAAVDQTDTVGQTLGPGDDDGVGVALDVVDVALAGHRPDQGGKSAFHRQQQSEAYRQHDT